MSGEESLILFNSCTLDLFDTDFDKNTMSNRTAAKKCMLNRIDIAMD